MNQDGRGRRGGGGGQGKEEGIDVDEVIHNLESGEMKRKIGKQFSFKQKALGELKGQFKLRPMPSTEEVLKVTQF